jgi:putative phosphoribosyl transferase
MFKDRADAGRKLAEALVKYKNHDVVVLAIPKGGMEIGYFVAQSLGVPLSLIFVRKLPNPQNPESGFGAVAEDGTVFIHEHAASLVPLHLIDWIIEETMKEIRRRARSLRGDEPFPDISGKTIILVDDGIAMGSTMRAAIRMCRNKNAGRIVIASPVTGKTQKEILELYADEVVILDTPHRFMAVADAYQSWYDVTDDEARSIMERNRQPLAVV